MKKFLLSIAISSASVIAFAQPTWDFETWSGSGAGIEPKGWVSENAVVLPPIYNNPQSVFKDSVNVHGGKYAMKITSVTMASNPAPTSLPDTIGLAAIGVVNLSPPSIKFGFGYTGRPNMISFWYEYAPVSGDTASCLVSLWNGSTHDTIAVGFWTTGAAQSTYANQNVTLNYNPAFASEFPDSMAVMFSSTKLFNPNYSLCFHCGKPGSNLWVDDVSFSGWNGINEHPSSKDMIVYPNPATDFVNIIADVNEAYSVNIFDVTGRKISSSLFTQSVNGMTRKETFINTSKFSAGIYSYSVLDKSGIAIREGKFNVVK